MGLRRQLGLQPHAMRRERRNRNNPNCALGASPQARLRLALRAPDRVHLEPYAVSVDEAS